MAIAAAKIADEKNLKVVCGYQRHYQNPYIGMVEQIKEGKIGRLCTAASTGTATASGNVRVRTAIPK